MTADEMFKELGYEKKEKKEYSYFEYNKKNTKVGETYTISFDIPSKTIMSALYIKGFIMSRALAMTPQEVKALNKKVEELEW